MKDHMACGSEYDHDCPLPKVPWLAEGTKLVGPCDDSMLRQCDVAWPSNTGVLTAAAPAAVLTWAITPVGFTRLYPVAMKLSVTSDNGATPMELDRLWGFSGVNYVQTNYVAAAGVVVPASIFGPYCARSLRLTELGEIVAGANPVTLNANLLAATFAGQLNITGIIFGRSIRGGMRFSPTP